ncbi:hypothetical protein PG997_005299 [Apiospora hydei]|uniref:Uncharacterized protein n=1 Tax=Apiospora hydei TaxID=1337664 RepID=A0ABR1X4J4_9PEZI
MDAIYENDHGQETYKPWLRDRSAHPLEDIQEQVEAALAFLCLFSPTSPWHMRLAQGTAPSPLPASPPATARHQASRRSTPPPLAAPGADGRGHPEDTGGGTDPSPAHADPGREAVADGKRTSTFDFDRVFAHGTDDAAVSDHVAPLVVEGLRFPPWSKRRSRQGPSQANDSVWMKVERPFGTSSQTRSSGVSTAEGKKIRTRRPDYVDLCPVDVSTTIHLEKMEVDRDDR